MSVITKPIIGASEDTWGSELNDYLDATKGAISVKEYGALGNGSTDDTAAMQAAKLAAVTTGRKLFFPAGTYKGSLTLLATDDYLTIVGESMFNTFLEAKDNATATILVPAGCHYITIENLTILNTGGTNNGTHYGIHSTGTGGGAGASGLRLRNLKVDGYNINIRLDEFNAHYLDSIWLSNAVHGGEAEPIGANVYAGHAVNHSTGLWMNNIHTALGKWGFFLATCDGADVNNLESLLATAQGFVHTVGGAPITGFNMSNCWFDSCGDGAMKVTNVCNGTFSNIWLSSGLTAGGAGNYGLWAYECCYNSFANIQSYGNTGNGFHLLTNSLGNALSNCKAQGNGGDGFLLANGAHGTILSACHSYLNTGTGYNLLDAAGRPNILANCSSLTDGAARVIQDKDIVIGGDIPGRVGQDTWDPGNIVVGAMEAKDVTVTGAKMGDIALVAFSLDLQDLVLDAQVTAANTVTCVLANNTAGAVNLGEGTVYVHIF